MSYWKGCLTGSARDVLESMPLDDANYDGAVQMLKDRFGKQCSLQIANGNSNGIKQHHHTKKTPQTDRKAFVITGGCWRGYEPENLLVHCHGKAARNRNFQLGNHPRKQYLDCSRTMQSSVTLC